MKEFKVKIEEIYTRTIVVKAENEKEAQELVEELCREGTIDLDYEDFIDRNIDNQGEASELDKDLFKTYQSDFNLIVSKIEEYGWSINYEGENLYRLATYSPAGQDFSINIELKKDIELSEFLKNLYECYENYDVSEEASLWVDSSGHGINGAPYKLEDIVDDMKWCEEQILELYEYLVEELEVE